mmetsp:Transcript_19696/g.51615  ORF Transcript_19696/g.51615 Transcript_19696/m.51615 type:complete len:200 (+) Transcript_19696:472-1071(+)
MLEERLCPLHLFLRLVVRELHRRVRAVRRRAHGRHLEQAQRLLNVSVLHRGRQLDLRQRLAQSDQRLQLTHRDRHGGGALASLAPLLFHVVPYLDVLRAQQVRRLLRQARRAPVAAVGHVFFHGLEVEVTFGPSRLVERLRVNVDPHHVLCDRPVARLIPHVPHDEDQIEARKDGRHQVDVLRCALEVVVPCSTAVPRC